MKSPRLALREDALREKYGEFLTLEDLAPLLRYPSVGAVRKARMRGQLPIPVIRLQHRRGWFATPRAVAEFLDQCDERGSPAAAPMRRDRSREQKAKRMSVGLQTHRDLMQ